MSDVVRTTSSSSSAAPERVGLCVRVLLETEDVRNSRSKAAYGVYWVRVFKKRRESKEKV